ncbi:MAG: PorT family protein [Bacteroidetes bacterium]|nr:PorT family protein [Bacteroidota bacterium]
MKKKSIIFLFISLMGFYSNSVAQVSCIETLWVILGLGPSKIMGGSYEDPLGLEFGLCSKFLNINKNMNLQTEIKYTTQGGKYAEDMYSGRVKLAYVHLPIMISYMKNKNGFFAEFGLQPGLLVSAKDEYTLQGSNEKITNDFKSKVNSFEFGIPLFVGYKLNNGLGCGIRYVQGLSKVEKSLSESNVNSFLSFRLFYIYVNTKKK